MDFNDRPLNIDSQPIRQQNQSHMLQFGTAVEHFLTHPGKNGRGHVRTRHAPHYLDAPNPRECLLRVEYFQ